MYICVAPGVAETFCAFGLSNDPAGLQTKVAAPVADNAADCPEQMVPLAGTELTEIDGGAATVRSFPLSDPVVAGFEAITRMRYPVPTANPLGIIAEIFRVPVAVEDKVPIAVGEANEPVLLDNWAVYTFPVLMVPETVKGTTIAISLFEQYVVDMIVPVVKVALAAEVPVIFTSSIENDGSIGALPTVFKNRNAIFKEAALSQAASVNVLLVQVVTLAILPVFKIQEAPLSSE